MASNTWERSECSSKFTQDQGNDNVILANLNVVVGGERGKKENPGKSNKTRQVFWNVVGWTVHVTAQKLNPDVLLVSKPD